MKRVGWRTGTELLINMDRHGVPARRSRMQRLQQTGQFCTGPHMLQNIGYPTWLNTCEEFKEKTRQLTQLFVFCQSSSLQ